jgi:alcohol dehydrogenase class IV
MRPFQFNAPAARVLFGGGTLARLPDEVDRLGLSRVLVLSTPQQTALGEAGLALLGGRAAGLFANAAMHTPVAVTDEAMRLVERLAVDGTAAMGGGSTIGLSKAIALRTDLPQIVVPTTYAGSEMTPVLGETENGVKTTRSSPRVQPETVIYDVALTLTLPPQASVTSGLNAMAHAVEALYAGDGNPITSLLAEEAIRMLVAALPGIVADPGDEAARSDALYAAWLCGTCLGQVGMALHHKLCHTLGGTFGLPHAETHSVVLPHAIAYNQIAAESAMARLARALGVVGEPAMAVHDLARRLGAPTALRDLGMPEAGIAEAASLAVANPYANPRPVARDAIEALLRRAWAGAPPQA